MGEDINLYYSSYPQPQYCQSSIRLWIMLWSITDIIIHLVVLRVYEYCLSVWQIQLAFFILVLYLVLWLQCVLICVFIVDINKYPHVHTHNCPQFIILLHTYDVRLPGNCVSKQNPSLHRGEAPSCWPARGSSPLAHTLLHNTAINVVSWSFLSTMSTWP